MTGQRQVYSLDLLSCSEEMYSSADTRGTFVFVYGCQAFYIFLYLFHMTLCVEFL